jgi:hypothetical protein
MGYAQETGYVPADINTIMSQIMTNINTQFQLDPPYTMETFVGTNAYKYFYALAQKHQENEVKTSEIFQKLQTYFDQINARISRPVVTNPGIIEKLETEGYIASVKQMIEADAGKINICVDADDGIRAEGDIEITSYANLVDGTDDTITVGATAFTAQTGAAALGAATFQAATSNAATAESLATQINAHAVAGLLVRAQAIGVMVYLTARHGGDAGNSIALAYAQLGTGDGATVSGAFLTGGEDNEGDDENPNYDEIRLALCTLISQITVAGAVTIGTEVESIVLSNGQSFDFKFNLPNRIQTTLRLTLTLSENNQLLVGSPDVVKEDLLSKVLARYRLGRNFEPQRYFAQSDAPWTSQVLLEWSHNYDPDDAGSATWSNEIYDANYDDLFELSLDNIILVEE